MELGTCSPVLGSNFRCIFSPNTKNLSGLYGFNYCPHEIFGKCFNFQSQTQRRSCKMVARTTKMVSNGYIGRDSSIRINNKMYTSMDSCLVVPPLSNRVKPRAIIKFLGGAFIGAVPEVTYSYLIEQLAQEGFLVVLVPYNVTFDHAEAAKQVYERFHACLDTIRTSGLPHAHLTPDQLVDLPLFSVGHSNGALLQLLTGSYFSDKIPKANAIISYNNRPATEAVPYFEQLGPVVSQMMPVVEASPVYSMARTASGDAWKVLLDVVGSIPGSNPEALLSLNKFVDQLPSVLNQVTQGVSEFKPTPSENRDCFKCSYNVQHTLLVKFNFDTIDETDILEETLKPRVESLGGTLKKIQLSGNHITPCFQEPKWEVGYVYTPADAIAQGLKTLSLNETRILSRTLGDWFRHFEN
ncbi:Eukaryotic initiation factor 4F subunit p150 [Quillaja saponaria]|uniref:Eukaryotic initiation factor 4F subunit p150 n=1 Tax=Quillaja saponaria TaxID=32244 RepID=A0AAD7LY82_QUISA|nr:Eukaryotic initiation factor 4F subunit p150 [Quillaja saponaria]